MPAPTEPLTPKAPDTLAVALPAEGYGSLFANKGFMALWIGQVFSQLADRIIFVVFVTLIVTHFGHQGSLKSLLYVTFTIPAILLTAIAGVFVDRWHRRNTLVITNLLRALIVAAIPLAIQAGSLVALYLCAFGISTATQFFVPAESATIPVVTRKSQLLVANSLFTTTMMGSVIFGFTLADPLIMMFGLKEVHWSIVGLFLISAAALSLVPVGYCREVNEKLMCTDKPVGSKPIQQALKDFASEMKEGVAYLRSEPAVLYKILKLAVLFSYVISMCIVFISFAESFLYADPSVAAQKFSWIIAFSGLGMVLGALSLGHWLRHLPKGIMVYTGYILIGLTLLALMGTPMLGQHPLIPAVFPYLDGRILFAHSMALLMGIGAALVAVPLQSVVHEMIPEDKRGKVMGVQFTLLSTASTLPAVLAGYGTDWLGVSTMLGVMGLPLMVFGIKGLMKRCKEGNLNDAPTW